MWFIIWERERKREEEREREREREREERTEKGWERDSKLLREKQSQKNLMSS